MATGCGECGIGEELRKWLNVGMSEKLSGHSVSAVMMPNSSFTVHSLFKDLAMVVHSAACRCSAVHATILQEERAKNMGGFARYEPSVHAFAFMPGFAKRFRSRITAARPLGG